MTMIRASVALLLLLLVCTLVSSAHSQTQKSVPITNNSGGTVALYWINALTREPVLLSDPPITEGQTFPVKTFTGHEFELREVPNTRGICSSPDQTCRSKYFVVTAADDQEIVIGPNFEVGSGGPAVADADDVPEVVSVCRQKALQLVEHSLDSAATTRAMDDMLGCVESGVVRKMQEINAQIAYHSQVRKNMAAYLENYTCLDNTADASPDIDTRVWTHKDGIDRTVHVKFERPTSRIHVLENFINPDECKAMEEAAKPSLHVATVADGKGGSKFSEHRKAMQAGIKVQWDKEEEGDLIAQLSRRVYDYVNHVLGLDIKENGQEDLMSIQYFGRGTNDTVPDRYTPHCDGACTGLPHKTGNRMATMVLYCDVPEVGGHTNFRNAGVHVVPVSGNGIFFSYIDPVTKVMDNGYTEHSGCPVFVGEKKIVTQWVRYGVDDENPWDSFNTLGVKHSDADES